MYVYIHRVCWVDILPNFPLSLSHILYLTSFPFESVMALNYYSHVHVAIVFSMHVQFSIERERNVGVYTCMCVLLITVLTDLFPHEEPDLNLVAIVLCVCAFVKCSTCMPCIISFMLVIVPLCVHVSGGCAG